MSHRRDEILLPIRYNDGSLVEPEKFKVTYEEIVTHVGAVTIRPATVHGIWTHEGQRFEDDSVHLYVDVEDTPESERFFRELKETLKERFRQIDVWIISYAIRIV